MLNFTALSALTALILSATSALAGSYTPPPPEPPLADPAPTLWQGAFAGLHVGYGATDNDISSPGAAAGPPGFAIRNSPDGFLGGGQIGYNFRDGRMVYGVIGDFTWMNLSDAKSNVVVGALPTTWETQYNWMASVRGRVGVLTNERTLIYGHAGLGYAEIRNHEIGGVGPWAGISKTDQEFGYILGAGVEAMAFGDISVFAEYSYMDFEDPGSLTPVAPPATISFRNHPVHMVKFGLNYHF